MAEKLVPMIHVPDVRATVAWYEALGFRVDAAHEDEGELSSLLSFGSGELMFNEGWQTGVATPREPLRRMTEAIAEARPKAIGVLTDFSPDESGYIDPRDPESFQFCLDLRRQKGVPVFLGVNRTLTGSPAAWLGEENYQSLAANLLIPRDGRRVLSEIRMREEDDPWHSWPSAAETKSNKAMSVARAYAYERPSGNSPGQSQTRLEAMWKGCASSGSSRPYPRRVSGWGWR